MPDLNPITVRRRCTECGAEWEGLGFPNAPDPALPRPGLCDSCRVKSDAYDAQLQRRATMPAEAALPEMRRPPRPPED